MGVVNFGIPKDIVIHLKELSKTKIFIETGTFHGWTSFWASKIFNEVKTIEFSKDIYDKTVETHKGLENVEFIFGDSREELKKIISQLEEPAIFWLDAHWCSFGSYGENDQCPLLNEIEILNSTDLNHIILIDDARLFLAPPALPNSIKYYPNISEVVNSLQKKDSYLLVYDDVIFSVPNNIKSGFIEFMQKKTTNDQLTLASNDRKTQQTKRIRRIIKKAIGYKYWGHA